MMARWLDLEVIPGRPLPSDRVGFVFNGSSLMLKVPGAAPQSWHPGLAYRRIRWGQDALSRVMALQPGESVLDCTLGMGHDALVLAHYGARISALEISPSQGFYSLQGISEWYPELSKRIRLTCADFHAHLPAQAPESFDHVYFDPMFPASNYDKHNSTWASLRAMHGGAEPPKNDSIEHGLRVARKSVLVKLPPRYNPPEKVAGIQGVVVGSKRVRYARWEK